MKRTHLLAIDLIRWLALLTVVIDHITAVIFNNQDNVSPSVWLWAMRILYFNKWGVPVFLILSGYLILTPGISDIGNFYQKRAARVFIPILFWNIFYYIYRIKFQGAEPTLGAFWRSFWNAGTYYHLYYLFIIAGLYLVSPLLSKLVRIININILAPSALIGGFIYLIGYNFWGWRLVINDVFIFLPYTGLYLSGYWISKWNFKRRRLMVWGIGWLLLAGVWANQMMMPIYGFGDKGTLLGNRLSLTIAAAAILIFYLLIGIKNEAIEKLKWEKVKTLAEVSFGVYLIHPIFVDYFQVNEPFKNMLTVSPFEWMTLTFISVLAISLVAVYLLRKVPVLNRIV